MNAPARDFSRESWRLKLARAKEHLDHLEMHVGRYLSRDVYRLKRVHRGKPNPYVWTFALDVVEQPDDQASLIFGDVVHNLRSALDHLAVALAPHDTGRIAFPIETVNIWETDASGNFVRGSNEARERYLTYVEGMSYEVLALIESLQPYNQRPPTPLRGVRRDQEPELSALRVLGLFDNTDKHRDLVRLSFALMGVVSLFIVRGLILGVGRGDNAHDGAEVAHRAIPPMENPSESEVEVRVFGTRVVTVEIGIKDSTIPVISNLRMIVDGMPEVFDLLEPHVLPGE